MLERIEAIGRATVLGDPFDAATTMGPLISQEQYDKVVAFIEAGEQEAELLFGGRHGGELVPDRPGGYWVEPTLFLAKDNSPRICKEEVFGPVAVVIPFDTDDEAIALANDSRYGLASGVWTTRPATGPPLRTRDPVRQRVGEHLYADPLRASLRRHQGQRLRPRRSERVQPRKGRRHLRGNLRRFDVVSETPRPRARREATRSHASWTTRSA